MGNCHAQFRDRPDRILAFSFPDRNILVNILQIAKIIRRTVLYKTQFRNIMSLQRRSRNEALQLLRPQRFNRQNLSGKERKRRRKRDVEKASEDKKERTSLLVNFDRKIVQVVVFVAFGGTSGNEG